MILDNQTDQFEREVYEEVVLSHGQFMMPGFIDAHTHAVQFPNLGLGYNKDLLDWLEIYTFPLEKEYSDMEFAERVFEAVVVRKQFYPRLHHKMYNYFRYSSLCLICMSLQKRTIKMGTTTACYFASLYADVCTILAQKTAELGQRAFIGKVNMNAPRDDGYCESTLASVIDTIDFIKSIEIIKVNANLYFIICNIVTR